MANKFKQKNIGVSKNSSVLGLKVKDMLQKPIPIANLIPQKPGLFSNSWTKSLNKMPKDIKKRIQKVENPPKYKPILDLNYQYPIQ